MHRFGEFDYGGRSLRQGDLDDALKKYEHVVEIEADPKNKDIIQNMSDDLGLSNLLQDRFDSYDAGELRNFWNVSKTALIMNEIYVTTNQREEAIGDTLSNPALAQKHDPDTIEVLYKETLSTLKPGRLWFLRCRERDSKFLSLTHIQTGTSLSQARLT